MYEFIDAALRTGLADPSRPGLGINDEQSNILKMVLAISTVVEGSGQSKIAYRLFESVREAADRTLHSGAIEIKSLPFLALVVRTIFVLCLLQRFGIINISARKKEKSGRGIEAY